MDQPHTMDDFDAIYEDDTGEEPAEDERHAVLVPEPIVLRGAGNMTVFVYSQFGFCYNKAFTHFYL